MITVSRLTAADFEECMDLIDLVFSQKNVPHDFEASVPKTNRPDEDCMRQYYGLREDGKLRAAILSWPEDAVVAGHPLRAYGIGNVATHHRCEGRGFMGMIMERVQAGMREEGGDLSFLGGLRQRYDHFGYDRCGLSYGFTVSLRNCRRRLGAAPQLTFAPMDAVDRTAMTFCRSLYENSPVHIRRGDDAQFLRHLVSWKTRAFVAFDETGAPVGYLCVRGDQIAEIFADTDARMADLVYAWLERGETDEVSFVIHPWEKSLYRLFDGFAEYIGIHADHQYKILSWDKVTAAFLELKTAYAPMQNGETVLGIEDWGNLAIRVKDGCAEAERTCRPAALTLPALTAQRMVFGPAAPYLAAQLPKELAALYTGWFPLPLSWNGRDNV